MHINDNDKLSSLKLSEINLKTFLKLIFFTLIWFQIKTIEAL